MKFEWPHSAKCGHGVTKIERRQDWFTGAVIYTIYCHGQTQSQMVSGLDLHDATMIWATAAVDEGPTDAYPSVTYVRPNSVPEGYTPGGGLSAGWQPKLTPQQEAENEARKALYLHTKSFYIDDKGLAKGRWVEDEQDRMAREQAAMDRPTPEARMEALQQIMLDPAEMERTANIALSFGPGVIQELRGPSEVSILERLPGGSSSGHAWEVPI